MSRYVKEFILDTIHAVHRQVGEVEVAGWLWTPTMRPGQNDWITIAHATAESFGTRWSVTLNDPWEAREQLPPDLRHLTLCGDFHSHCIAGSTVPSPADCKAWAGTGDMLGRDCYVSVIVAPSEQVGWSSPTFTPWIAYRRGRPSRAFVARAALEW